MSFSFGFGKYKKQNPNDYADFLDDEYDYEYGEEFVFSDDYVDDERYDI
jgi:hypothetical protein